MGRLTTIELYKERMGFSAGHFTILTPTKRERLHGHNYQVYCALTTVVNETLGMTFDYREYKKQLDVLCRELNEVFLIPGKSPYVSVQTIGEYIYVHFNNEKIPFLKNDILILPVVNITVEELSNWFLNHLIADVDKLKKNEIQKIFIKVSSSPGQYGSSTWEKPL